MAARVVEQTSIRRSLWLGWVLANAVGWAMGGALAGATIQAREHIFDGAVTPAMYGAGFVVLTTAVAFGMFGITLGVIQWLALRRTFGRTSWWVLATGVSWAFAGAVAGSLSWALFGGTVTGVGLRYNVAVAGGTLAVGLLPGLLQWQLLRRQVRGAVWWLAANLAGIVVGTAIALPVLLAGSRVLKWELPSAEAWGIAGIVDGTVVGAVTGTVLNSLRRQSAEHEG